MSQQDTTKELVYTYRNGKKVRLVKEPDQIVVRAKPEELIRKGVIGNLERVSSGSTKMTVKSDALGPLMTEMRNDAVTHHAYTQVDNNAEFLITDRIIVTFRQAIDNDTLSGFIAKYALILRSKYSEREYLFQLTNQTRMNPVKLVVLINEADTDIVESCEHDLNKRMTVSVATPADVKYLQQWHLHTHLTHAAFDPRSSSNCEGAWRLLDNFGSNDVVIAVSDDGCKIDHFDFDTVNKFSSWGYLQGNTLIHRESISANLQNMYLEGADHGTCCCGVVASEVDGSLTVGAAPGCRLLPIKWESSGPSLFISDSKLMTVLMFIADKSDVFSNSWGSSPESNFAVNVLNKIEQLALNGGRRGKGIVFLWAAGNENCPIKYSGNEDIPYDNGYDQHGRWKGVSKSRIFEHNLTSIPGVMHVAALASNAQRSHYSNYGEGISICAPSSNSHEYWRMAVTGLGILTTSGRSPFFDSEFGGTSSATPLVAGIAGLVISANPDLSALEVISILQKTANKDLNMAPYPKTPPANYDQDTAWDISPVAPFSTGAFTDINHEDGSWSGWFGFGKVDANAAVAEAIRLRANGAVTSDKVVHSSSPAIGIPDNNTIGISDIITIDHPGRVTSLSIDLELTHPYIGDLVITLTSPGGMSAVLHSRNGGSLKNIFKTYDINSTPTLARIIGEPARGEWKISIVDAAPQDTGVLDKWTINIGTGLVQTITVEDTPGLSIPDNNQSGIERNISVNDSGILKDIEIGIDLTHSYIGDLMINLVSPAGSVVTLHNRTGNSTDNIIKKYNPLNTPGLSVLKSQPIQGSWKLIAMDLEGQDTGKLNKWSITITVA